AVGAEVPEALVGQPVCALVAGGGYAEYCVAPVGQCLPVSAALTMVEAAAMPETLFTVWSNLFERAYAMEGESALVHGGTSGIGAEINIARIMGRRLTLTGSTLRPRSVAFKSLVADEIARSVWPFVEEGRLKPVVHATFPLAEVASAHAMMEAGDHIGKIVLV